MNQLRCIFPCRKVFAGEMDLARHYNQRPACKVSWNIRLKRAAETAERNAFIEAHNHTTIPTNQDMTMDMDSWNSIDDDGGDQNENNNDNDEGDIAALGGPVVSNGVSAAGPSDQPVQDNNSDRVPEFDIYMFGSGDTVHGSEERVNPCLDEGNGDAEENEYNEPPPMETLVDELEDALENVQIDPEGDEESDPSEIVSFTRAGEIKSHAKSHFESILGEEDWSPFHPFAGAAEFQMAKWLNDLPLSKVDSFLQLDWVRVLIF
jgi:hypothetical protein